MAGALERLHPGLQRRVKESGWLGLSDIQEAAIPVILEGHDCVIQAPTAGGKTEAVLFPTLTRAASATGPGVRVLYIAPLRALLNNLEERGERYAQDCALHAFKWHGDVSQKNKIDAMSHAPELLLTTPESIEAILLRKGNWKEFFQNLQSVIIDEAHNFAAGDRGGHLVSLLERIERGAGCRPQRIALSATVANIDDFLTWLVGNREQPARAVDVGSKVKGKDYGVSLFVGGEAGEEDIPEHQPGFQRFSALCGLIRNKRSIVFVRSRSATERLARAFELSARSSESKGIKVRTHHSAVSKFFREEAEQLIQVCSEHGINGIISTSTLELGIDIGELDSVVQFDALASPSAFLQRVGRTGRRPGKPQFFRGLCVDPEDIPLVAAVVNLGLGGQSEAIPLNRRSFHLLAHQLICLSLQHNGVDKKQAWETLSAAHCFAGIVQDEYAELIEHMVREDFLRDERGLLLVAEATEKYFLGSGWRKLFAVFDSAPMYDVLDEKNQVGTLDANFVETHKVPFIFTLAARPWKAMHVDPKRRIVRAKIATGGTAPSWKCFGGADVPYETAQEVGRLLHGDECPSFLDKHAAGALQDQQHLHKHIKWRPGKIAMSDSPGYRISVLTYAGDSINRTLAFAIKSEGIVNATSNYQGVIVQYPKKNEEGVKEFLTNTLERLASGDQEIVTELRSTLTYLLPNIPFSPFHRCLSPRLSREVLLEKSLNIAGLVSACRGSSFVIQG